MPRPRLGDQPMTAAERDARRRQRNRDAREEVAALVEALTQAANALSIAAGMLDEKGDQVGAEYARLAETRARGAPILARSIPR